MILMTLNYGKYGIFLSMGNAGFISSTVLPIIPTLLSPSFASCVVGTQSWVWGLGFMLFLGQAP